MQTVDDETRTGIPVDNSPSHTIDDTPAPKTRNRTNRRNGHAKTAPQEPTDNINPYTGRPRTALYDVTTKPADGKPRDNLPGVMRRTAVLDEYLRNGGNGTQAYLTIAPHVKVQTANTEASKILRSPHVTAEIQAILDRTAAGYEVQIITLSDIARGVAESTTTTRTVQIGEDGLPTGRAVETTVVRQCTPSDRIQAVKLLDRLSGGADSRRIRADAMGAELRTLYRDVMRTIRDEGMRGRGDGTGDAAQGGEGGERV